MKNKNISKERKIFLNSLNCWVSNFIIEEIRTDYNPDAKIKYNFMGTLNTSDQPLPRYFEPKITKIEIGYNYNQEVFNNDIIIYNLDDSNLSEVEFIIRGLKNIKFENDKILVLISNIMTWAKTPLKIRTKEEMEKEGFDEEEFFEFKEEEIKKEEEEEKKEENEENNNEENEVKPSRKESKINEENEAKKSRKESQMEENNDNNNDNNEEENKKEEEKIEPENIQKEPELERPHIFYYKDSEFTERIPHKKYFQYKLLEMQALQINKPNLKVFIICPGFIYGCGEDFFFDYFRNAFLGKKINIIGEGKNSLPTIHIKDLASIIKKIIEKKAFNSNRYFFAVDHTKNPSMINIISSISKAIGDGTINKITDFDIDEIDIPNYEEINIDLKIKTSSVLEDKRKQGEDIEDFDKRKFKWHCEFGIPENLELLRNEFNLYRNLKPIKILVLGPPSSGKSTICKFLSHKFKILTLKIDEIIEWCKNLNNSDPNSEENKISTELKNKIQELEENVQIAQEEYEKRKNKKKTDPPFDPVQYKKIPNELLYKVLKLRLKSSDCLSKGFILDGFPKNYNDALELFNDIKREEIVEEEVENVHNKNKSKNNVEEKKEPKIIEINLIKEIFPDSVILIDNYNEENLKKKMVLLNKDYEEKQMEYDNRFNRRLHKYKEDNETEGKKNLKDFFNENKLEIFLYDEQKNINFPEPKQEEEQQQQENNITENNNKNVNNNNNNENNNNNNNENNENIENENNIENEENEEENKEKTIEEKTIIKEPLDFININKYLERNGPINNIERLTDDDDIIPIGEDDINDEEDDKILNQHDLSNELEKHLNESSQIDSYIEKKQSEKIILEKKESNEKKNNENSNIKQIIEKEEKENKIEKDEEEKINELKEREKKLLEKKSEILRRYLSENVIPLLAKGVLNICQNLPEDPVDALANFLLENTFNNAIKKNNNNNNDNNNIDNNNNINLNNIDVEEIKKNEDDNLNISKLTENSIVNMEKK